MAGETDADGADADHPPHSGRSNESAPGWKNAVVNAILAIAEARAAAVELGLDGEPADGSNCKKRDSEKAYAGWPHGIDQ